MKIRIELKSGKILTEYSETLQQANERWKVGELIRVGKKIDTIVDVKITKH